MLNLLFQRMLSNLYQWFWKDEFWFPAGYTWTDMEDANGVTYPHPKDLLATIPLAFILVIVRYSFERTIGIHLSRIMGVRDHIRLKAAPNPNLESFFQTQSWNPKEAQLSLLVNQCGLSVRQAQCWFHYRRNQEQPNLTKFCESSWRFLFYFSSFFGGLFTLYNETWFWEPTTCFEGYLNQPLKIGIYCWYLLEMSFYHSLLLTLPFDVKRKDTMEHVIHHFVTITLMFFSYCCNFVHIGALTLLLHDITDVLLEANKMFHYAQWENTSEILFIIFSVVFIFNRLILFPTKIINTTLYHYTLKPFFGYYVMITFLIILQGLHVFWSYFILSMVYSFVVDDEVKNDMRSDSEEQDTSDEQTKPERERKKSIQYSDDTNSSNLLRTRGQLVLKN
ncbi:ceramide synthase 4-like isoform X1 [Monodelphis domestica]|uniref:ceramide synthase 4-like isoform X1 n=2 Tax=Monodelphis domestica TaxID=13616 RepID=UPI0024E273C3|nr:ceramide synthase 4-like isoform X1 [Monodelphis domestica]